MNSYQPAKENIFSIIGQHPGSDTALVDAESGRSVTYRELRDGALAVAEQLRSRAPRREVHYLYCSNDIPSLITYLGCIAADLPVCLLDGSRPELASRILSAYRSSVVLGQAAPEPYSAEVILPGGLRLFISDDSQSEDDSPHSSLALLLTTSGSTGDPKLVRLTHLNLLSNARSIAEYLELNASERCIQSLPMYYSYGLSLVHSHLLAGATIVLSPHSFLRPEFWKHVKDSRCTSFAGVPHMYETLKRLRFDLASYPDLRTLTQAGGKLNESLIQWYCDAAMRNGRRFFVMYGQTEATARISYVPHEALPSKIGSIGIPIPGGVIDLVPVDGVSGLNELVYRGPNVMMGYADSAASLTQGDQLNGVLHTGDVGRVDDDGFFYIVGRLKHFAKLFGKRVNLTDVEAMLEARFPVLAAAHDSGRDQLILTLECLREVDLEEIVLETASTLGVPPNAVRSRQVSQLPRTPTGKKDYAALAEL